MSLAATVEPMADLPAGVAERLARVEGEPEALPSSLARLETQLGPRAGSPSARTGARTSFGQDRQA